MPRLYLFLEGNDDERFFSRILSPFLLRKYSEIRMLQYAQDAPKATRKYIRSVQSAGDEYVFAKDLNDAPCVTARKQKVVSQYQVDEEKIIVIVKEIECWYLCGLDHECCRKLGIERRFSNTSDMNKEDFETLIPHGMTRLEFMQQILEKHDIEVGKQKNQSFRYFLGKWTEQ